MSQRKIRSANACVLDVLDFRCDFCQLKLDAVVIALQSTGKKIVKSYHEACWKRVQGSSLLYPKLAPPAKEN